MRLLLSIHNAVYILLRHKILYIILVLMVALGIFQVGQQIHRYQIAKNRQTEYMSHYGDFSSFPTPGMDESVYSAFIHENGHELFLSISDFLDKLRSNSEFTFLSKMAQPVDIFESVPDTFLYGYEYGTKESSVYEYGGKTRCFVKALQVSQSFFEAEDVSLASGHLFEASDYRFLDGAPIPVLLGSAYKGYFQEGDRIEGNYLGKDVSFQVLGFLSENSFFYQYADNRMTSCENYILLPAMSFTTNQDSDFARLVLAQQLYGEIRTSQTYSYLLNQIEALLKQCGLDSRYFRVSSFDSEDITALSALDTYSSMTESVSNQFFILAGLSVILSAVTVGLSLSSFVLERKRIYGVQLLYGANMTNTVLDMLVLTGVHILPADWIACMFLYANGVSSLLLIELQAINGCIWCITFAFPFAKLYFLPLSELIGGKE